MGVLAFSALPLLSRKNEHITVGLLDHLFTGKFKIIASISRERARVASSLLDK